MAELTSFLRSAMRRRFDWGRDDCLLFPADWWRVLTGLDPAAGWRGTYSDEVGAEVILAAAGGREALAGIAMTRCGGVVVETPQAGDVGLVRVVTPTGAEDLAGAVCTGGRWASLAPAGLAVGHVSRVEAVRIWRWRDRCRR